MSDVVTPEDALSWLAEHDAVARYLVQDGHRHLRVGVRVGPNDSVVAVVSVENSAADALVSGVREAAAELMVRGRRGRLALA